MNHVIYLCGIVIYESVTMPLSSKVSPVPYGDVKIIHWDSPNIPT